MNIETHLQFGDNTEELYDRDYLVVEFHSNFSRGGNGLGPVSLPDCTALEVILVAPPKSDLELQEWYFSKSLKSGRILFGMMDFSSSGDRVFSRALRFWDAQCFSIGEKYDIDGESLRLVKLVIHCLRSEMSEVSFGCGDGTEN